MAKHLLNDVTDHSDTDGDAPQDAGVAASRETGGVDQPDQPDQASTTGTTPDDTFVGRVAGDDVGYAGETGAEARAEAERAHDQDDAHAHDDVVRNEDGSPVTRAVPPEPGVCC